MRKLALSVLLLLPLLTLGQFKITGKVIDSTDKKTIPGATVFLSNASVGTATTVDGTFSLDNVRGGQYELVVSMIGYKSYRTVLLVNDNITLPVIEISSKSIGLQQVTIRPDPEWERNYERFRVQFLGYSEYAKKCKILNPEVLDIHYDKDKKILTAKSIDYVEIENKALGYKVKYMLEEFEQDSRQNVLYYAGTASFEAMKGKKADERRWEKTRFRAYQGSSMHFLRSLLDDNLALQGFEVLRLIRKPNPDYKGGFEAKYLEGLVINPVLTRDSFLKRTDHQGLYVIIYKDCLHVSYSPGADFEYERNHAPTNIILNKPYALFDNNGIFIDPGAVTFEGEWGNSRMAELLPVDYEPPKK